MVKSVAALSQIASGNLGSRLFNNPKDATCLLRILSSSQADKAHDDEGIWYFGHEMFLSQSRTISHAFDAIRMGLNEGTVYHDSAGCKVSHDAFGVRNLLKQDASGTSVSIIITVIVPVAELFDVVIYDMYTGKGSDKLYRLLSDGFHSIAAASRIVDMLDIANPRTKELCLKAATIILKETGGWKPSSRGCFRNDAGPSSGSISSASTDVSSTVDSSVASTAAHEACSYPPPETIHLMKHQMQRYITAGK
ncbi:hypothetical protein SeLEV6574_g01891 [Synchytrium endobioticum]|nr:hypothetical protein SeLEV6574_g01891 [Synchytrium endobioticum]